MLKEKTVSEIKAMLAQGKLTAEMAANLRRDPRKGVQHLYRLLKQQSRAQAEERQRVQRLLAFDRSHYPDRGLLAGTDEAGRGPLAGPVVAAAVILPKDLDLNIPIDDSKNIPAEKRAIIAAQVKACAEDWAVAVVGPDIIDQINILQASIRAMRQAVACLNRQPQLVLCDGIHIRGLGVDNKCIIKGDAQSAAIAAASIIAKVERDAVMQEYARQYPGYGFAQHMGYPTKLHREAIKKFGVTPIHRRTFAGVREWC